MNNNTKLIWGFRTLLLICAVAFELIGHRDAAIWAGFGIFWTFILFS